MSPTADRLGHPLGGGPGGGEDGVGTRIGEWVAAHATATDVGGTTVDDRTQPAS
ncbi:hypothetical protein [Actinomycetospora callitridis]|uniref:hypothetical protein n=1 Tax=Actinomycetospora callitridis TaxID=913944 RepID=UPI0023652526|nr:hypothetical protein [Actinomycetospora callitridis]MDD7921028.1 hypothetical protein [Actinomycetospora callitridis]